jgi:hypothetical protein
MDQGHYLHAIYFANEMIAELVMICEAMRKFQKRNGIAYVWTMPNLTGQTS